MKEMIPYLAATGRDKYTKSVRWFLNEMKLLPDSVKKQFLEGYFVVRRKSAFYGACSGDYAIETTLMASFKGKTGW